MTADERKVLVLKAIEVPMTVRDVSHSCSITYLNAYYTLRRLHSFGLCHISAWVWDGGTRPMAVYAAGAGEDAPDIRSKSTPRPTSRTRSDVMVADAAIRTAVNLWVKSKEDEEDDQA